MSAAERTCVVCRLKAGKRDLVRFVFSREKNQVEAVVSSSEEEPKFSRQLKLDLKQNLPGRGVYCHKTGKCLFGRDTEKRLRFSLNRRVGASARSGHSESAGNLIEVFREVLSGSKRGLTEEELEVINCLSNYVQDRNKEQIEKNPYERTQRGKLRL